MDDGRDGWMRVNLLKGLGCLAIGAIVIAVVEYVWDYASANRVAGEGFAIGGGASTGRDGLAASDGVPDVEQMMAFVIDGDEAGLDTGGLPEEFLRECFDPRGIGEVRTSIDGGVVGIVSDWEADDLYRMCSDSLCGNGWIRAQGSQGRHGSFLKEAGSYRWAFLDVTQVNDSGVAVIVLEGRS